MKVKNYLKKALKLFVFALLMFPVIYADALENQIEYKVYDSNNNYEFSCMVMDDLGRPEDYIDYSIRSCIANNKNVKADRITINRNDTNVFYNIEYGNGTLKWNGDINTDWYDENSLVYYIKNEKELAGLAYLVNTGNTFKDKTIKITSDIDLLGYSWIPIGKNYTYAFEGNLDGQGYTVENLNFEIYDDINYYGLFGYVNGSTIKNLTVDLDVDIFYESNTELYIAGVSGYSSGATFDSIMSIGKMDVNIANANVSGIVSGGSMNVLNSQSYVDIISSAYNIAGIAATAQRISVMNCVNFGNLHSTSISNGGRVAGITSWVYGGTFQYSINYGTIVADNNSILKGSIIGYSGYEGETYNHVYSQDNINIVSGETNSTSEKITSENLEEVLAILNQNDNWQIVDGKIVNILTDIKPYIINVSSDNNGEVYYSGKENNVIVINALSNKGYELNTIEVYDGNNQKIELNGNEFIMSNSDVTINVTFKPIEYKFISGENAVYQNTDLVFTLDGDYDLVDKVLINGMELDSNDYTIAKGSTVLTLKDEYLKTLDFAKYKLTVTYTNGSSVTTTFTIGEEQNITTPIEDTVDNPNTFDGILFYVGLGLVSIIGLATVGIYFNKYAHKKAR